ncbi:hypothetical protein P8C59_001621 [Phyllachora maydis]|uniref:Zn(2)-C6 fungal-type domain-containing protein n=1 Tax=Phyllachora maydis TaxID=1825666 RepID=A0AAD9M9C9_9PEZI|nr:hypothetical protein P8C59_001621 [Phyllachora maydis]
MDHLHAGFQMSMAPPLMNQPPQIFGGYSDHGLSTSQLPPDMLSAHMFADHGMMDDTNEAKRRRIARACDMCRKKKIKCDGKLPACTHCVNYKTECIFTQVEKKRNPPKGAKYIEGLENRLGRMESLLRLSGLLGEDDGATDLGTLEKKLAEKHQQAARHACHVASNPTSPSQATSGQDGPASTPQSALTSPEPAKERDVERRKSSTPEKEKAEGDEEVEEEEEEVAALSEMMCSLVTNNCGETRYIGSSSGFSIFSPKGIEWVNQKMGDTSFSRMITDVSIDDHKWTAWKPDIFQDIFRRPVFIDLPPKPETSSLLKDYFENFNYMFPLFHQPTFMHLVERQYSNDPYQGSGWWASLNVVLAIAYRLRVMSHLVPAEEDNKAWSYLKNAMGVLSELTMRNTDLLSVQALLGIAMFMQGTPNPQPSFLLIASAIRLCHTIGLHRKGTGFNLNPVEIEQRKRVFWIAYMLDKDICLRSGRPPAQDDDDMNVDLPDADPPDMIGNIPLADGKGKMNLFRTMCELALIQSKVYKRLYASKATRQSDGELLNTIGELDQELDDWKDSISIDFRPEHEIKASHTPLILHVVMLHFTYYNCLTTIHRMSIHHGYWTSRLSNYAIQGLNAKPLNPRVFSSAALCTSAARASISLLKYIPQGDFSCVWMVLYFPVSALVTLFGNILQNPLDPRAKSDVRLMAIVVSFLSMLGQEAEQGGVHRMLGVCSEFERIAKVVIEKGKKEHSARRKRKSHEQASAQSLTHDHKHNNYNNHNNNNNKPHAGAATTPTTPTPQASAARPNSGGHQHHFPASYGQGDGGLNDFGSMTAASSMSQQSSPDAPPPGWPGDIATQRQNQQHQQRQQHEQQRQQQQQQQQQQQHRQQQTQYSNGHSVDDFGAADFAASFADLTGLGVLDTGNSGAHGFDMAMCSGGGGLQSPPPFGSGNIMLPADLYSLPMTLDWDWAEMCGGAVAYQLGSRAQGGPGQLREWGMHCATSPTPAKPAKITPAVRRIAARKAKQRKSAKACAIAGRAAATKRYKKRKKAVANTQAYKLAKKKDLRRSKRTAGSDAGRYTTNSGLTADKDNNNVYNRAYMPPAKAEEEEEGSSGDNDSVNSSTSDSANKSKGSSTYKRSKGALRYEDTPLRKQQRVVSYPRSPPSTPYANIYIYYV